MFVGIEIVVVCFAVRGRLSALSASARRAWTARYGQILAACWTGRVGCAPGAVLPVRGP